MEYFQ